MPSSLRARFVFLASFLALAAPVLPAQAANGLHCRLLPDLFSYYLSKHYSQPRFDDELRSKTIVQFVKIIDPTKSVLLDRDVSQIRSSLTQLFKSVEKGDCKGIDEVFTLLSKRTKENEDFVRQLLGKNYKIDDTASFKADPDQREYAKTEKAKNDLLSALVHFQVSNALLARSEKTEAEKMTKAKEQIIHRYELATKRVADKGTGDLVALLGESFARALDPHSSFMPPDEAADFQIRMQLSLEGIGVSLSSNDGYVTVEQIIPGGSADRAKALKPEDQITAVAQGEDGEPVSVIDMDLSDVVKLIRGKKGTKVKLTILRKGSKIETFNVTLVRDKVDMADQAAKITYETRKVGNHSYKIGILDLPSFYGGSGVGITRDVYRDTKKLLEQAKRNKVDGLILDLTRNGGGLLDKCVQLAGLFVRKGNMVATQDTRRNKEILSDSDSGITYSGPLIVLTSRGSASASEILAGALKDYGRALVIGNDHTFGKGTVQVLEGQSPDIGATKVTTQMFFLPKGDSTQWTGVESDLVLPPSFILDSFGEKHLDNSLKPAKIESFASMTDVNYPESDSRYWKPVDPAVVKTLTEASRKRVATDPKFVELQKDLEEAKKNRGTVKIADLRKRSEEDKKKSDAEKKKLKDRRAGEIDLDNPQLQESIRIMADWLALDAKPLAASANPKPGVQTQ